MQAEMQMPFSQAQQNENCVNHERFLTIDEVCNRAGYCPATVHSYRARSLSHKLKLPAIIKRGDGRLGCLESVLNKFLSDNYGPKGEAA